MKCTEMPPIIYNGGIYRSDSRTLPSSVQKIPFLKSFNCKKQCKGGIAWGEK
nr:MAG TPA: hypothetical protein [Caudoviricetes sp.]